MFKANAPGAAGHIEADQIHPGIEGRTNILGPGKSADLDPWVHFP